MTETADSPPTNFFKIILVAFPLGLIVLGAASFVIYFNKRDKAEERSQKYAAGLREELNAGKLAHYANIVATTASGPKAADAMAAFIESTTGPENMGYEVRTIPYYDNAASPIPGLGANTGSNPERRVLDIEVSGKQRRHDLVVLVTDYLPASNSIAGLDKPKASGVPAFLGLAHASTGRSNVRSLRFVAVPDLAGLTAWANDMRDRGDRVTHLQVIGGLAALTDTALHEAMYTANEGVVIMRPEYATLEQITALQTSLLDLTARQ